MFLLSTVYALLIALSLASRVFVFSNKHRLFYCTYRYICNDFVGLLVKNLTLQGLPCIPFFLYRDPIKQHSTISCLIKRCVAVLNYLFIVSNL